MDMWIVAEYRRKGTRYLIGVRPYLTADGWYFAAFLRPEHAAKWKLSHLRDYVLCRDLLEDIGIEFGDSVRWLIASEECHTDAAN